MPPMKDTVKVRGDLIQKLRNARPPNWETQKKKGTSQKELAAEARISRSYLSEIENGLKDPNVRVVIDIAEVLGVDFTDLIAEEETKEFTR